MKHIKTILLVITIFSFLSFQTTNSVEGKWELFKLEDSSGEVKEMSGRWMQFNKGGELKGGNSPETTNRTGKWAYNAETKELTISSEQNLSGEGTFKVNWIDAKTFTLEVQQGRKVHLRRMK